MRKHLLVYFGIVAIALSVILAWRAMTKHPPAEAKALAALVEYSPGANRTPGDRSISTAQALIGRAPSDARGYNLLASAFMQKARETGDFSFNARAEAALKESLKLNADDYDALKLRAKLLLSYHKFKEALDVAHRAQGINPNDHDIYGALTDALVELGDYPAAVEAAQRMVDLRPETSSYSRVSYLRRLHGDTAGAIEAMRLAITAADPQDPENRAWCMMRLGDDLMMGGKPEEAEREYDRALHVFPDYYAALAAKARARAAVGDTAAAVELYRRAQERVPLPETVIALGDLYQSMGRGDEATRQYQLVEFIERKGAAGTETYSMQLALFWADRDMNLDEALAVAERERATRSDIYTSDALAWCLYKKGRLGEAQTAINEALRLGTRDPLLFYHAGMIANALDDPRAAAKYLQQALAVNPAFHILQADIARRTLANIKT